MSEVQGMNYLCCENIVADHLTAQLLGSCSELFWHMKSMFPHDVAQTDHVQITSLCLLIDVKTRLLKRNTLMQK